MIATGRVTVNGKSVVPGARVEPDVDCVELDGLRIQPEQKIYIMVNKPRGVVSAADDEDTRETVVDLVHGIHERLFPAGRLDKDEEGAILLTNDGSLAHRLASPGHGVERTYIVSVHGEIDEEKLELLREGVMMRGGVTTRAQALVLRQGLGTTLLRAKFWESRGKSLRRLFAAVGNRVLELKSVAIGPVHMGGLEPGQWRRLTDDEVARLKAHIQRGANRLSTLAEKPPP